MSLSVPGFVWGVAGNLGSVGRKLWACWFVSLLVACAGSAPPPARSAGSSAEDDAVLRDPILDEVMKEENARLEARRAERAARSAKATSGTTSADHARGRTVGVRGITGSLTRFEVEQAMNTRRADLLACVKQRPRSLGHVAGDISFHIDVDGHGRAERVLVTQSDIGYAPLEDCLTAVVAAAQFPVPAGAQPAETQWGMSVDPLRRPPEPIDSAELEDTISRQSQATYESCGIGKKRRFLVNGYLGSNGTLHPVSVRIHWRGPARADDDSREQLTCLADALEQWTQWPKRRGISKVNFELRWVAAPPPPPRHRGRARHRH